MITNSHLPLLDIALVLLPGLPQLLAQALAQALYGRPLLLLFPVASLKLLARIVLDYLLYLFSRRTTGSHPRTQGQVDRIL